MTNNQQLIAHNCQRFLDGDLDAAKATWSPDSQWHGLAPSNVMTLGRDDYFSMLTSFFAAVPDYGFSPKSVTGYGDRLVVLDVDSWGTDIQPGGGLMVFRIDNGQIVACAALSGQADPAGPF